MTIFTRIIKGELPASLVWQDEQCVVFMDINPMSPGHTLVVPRSEVATLAELDAPTRGHLWHVGQRVALAQQQALGSKAQHFLVNDGKAASQTVPHVHLHVIPRYGNDRLATMRRMTWHLLTLPLPTKLSSKQRRQLDQQAKAIAEYL